jgi:hypothetical protein
MAFAGEDQRFRVFALMEDNAGRNPNISLPDMISVMRLRAADAEHNNAMVQNNNQLLTHKLATLRQLGWSYDDVRIETKTPRKRTTRATTNSRYLRNNDLELLKYNNVPFFQDVWLSLLRSPDFHTKFAEALTRLCARHFVFHIMQRMKLVTPAQIASHICYIEEIWYHATRHEIHMLVVDEDLDITKDISMKKYGTLTSQRLAAFVSQSKARIENVAMWVCINFDRQVNELIPRIPRLQHVYHDDPRKQRERFIKDPALFKIY